MSMKDVNDKADKDPLAPARKLGREVLSRRVVIKKRDGKELIDAPLVAGLGAMLLFAPWSAIGVAAALVTDHSIVVRRRESTKPADKPASKPAAAPAKQTAEEPAGGAAAEAEPAQCAATTKSGSRCKLPAQPGSPFCHIHAPD